MKRLIIVLCFLTLTFTLSAQDDSPKYQLREPTAREYLQSWTSILETADAESIPAEDGYPGHAQRLSDTMTGELLWRYGDLSHLEPETIYQAVISTRQYAGFFDEREYFIQQMILSIIQNHSGDWNTIADSTSIDDLALMISPRDYDADGQDELMVEVQSSYYNNYLVLRHTEDGYEIVPSPLPWTGCCYSYWSSRSGFMVEQYFGDMTGDDIPEWVVAFGGIGGNHMNHGWIYILQWQDGELVDLTPDIPGADELNEMIYSAGAGGGAPLFPNGVSVDIRNTDENNTTEIIINQRFSDTWDCEFDQARIFAWDGVGFSLAERQQTFLETGNCALRFARELTWQGAIDEAIPYYELSLERFATEPLVDAREYEQHQHEAYIAYTAVHLALIEAIRGHTDKAMALLTAIENEPTEDIDPIPELVNLSRNRYAENQNAFDLCLTMYDVFYRYHHETTFPNPYWGHTLDVPAHYGGGGGSGAAPIPDAGRAGCDIRFFLDTALANATLNTSQNPVQQLTALGIQVQEAHAFDLNQDGNDEWLITFELPTVPALLLISDGNQYQYSMIDMDYIDSHTDFGVVDLPDDNGTTLVQVYFDPTTEDNHLNAYSRWRFCPLPDDAPSAIGFVNVWQLQEDELELIQQEWICDDVSIDAILPDDHKIMHVWIEPDEYTDDRNKILVPMSLYWDSVQGKYLPHTESVEDDAEIEDVSPPSITELFVEGNYEAVIALQIPEPTPSSSDDYIRDYPMSLQYMYRYYRAMAFEALDRPDDALAEYVTIYEAAPESAWGMLAALHIEEIDE